MSSASEWPSTRMNRMAERKKRETWKIDGVRVEPNTWKAIATAFVMAVADVASALRDIAEALDTEGPT